MFGSLGFGEILVICIVLIIVVGPERLPSLMKNVGKAVRTVRQASREIQATVGLDELLREDVLYTPPDPPSPPPAATISRGALPEATADAEAPATTAAPSAGADTAATPAIPASAAQTPSTKTEPGVAQAPAPASPSVPASVPAPAPAARAPEAPGGEQGQG
jgi:sec-independent protein translocase protein TatB